MLLRRRRQVYSILLSQREKNERKHRFCVFVWKSNLRAALIFIDIYVCDDGQVQMQIDYVGTFFAEEFLYGGIFA